MKTNKKIRGAIKEEENPGTPNIHLVYTMKAKHYTETYTYTPWLKDLLAELTTSKLCSVSACRLNYNLNVCIENIVA